ncbi:MAG: hypothetical protein EF812_01685 [Methanosarcinales archaeon]|nr:MAG: hypothetical protein EF812_01685 [Methanosarcinales archaeon]
MKLWVGCDLRCITDHIIPKVNVMQAQTLKDAIRVFDPRKTLDGEGLNEYHTDRIPNRKEDPAITKLKTQLDADAQKILFSGHRGCGKSTELNKLALDLEKERPGLLIVKYNVTDVLDVFDLEYSDVLFSLAYQLYHKAETIGVKIDKAVVDNIEEFVGCVTRDFEEIKEKKVGLGVMFQKLFVGKYQQERLTRETVRKQLKPRISRLIELINSMVVQIKLAGYDALIIIDGIDNSPLDIGKNLYYGFGQVLSKPDCAIIYTIPISVVYSSEFTVIQQSFDKTVILPNITVTNRDGSQNEDGISIFSNLSERRMRPDLIGEDALRYAIRMSAGITREFIRTIKDSCVEAIVRGGDRIICDDVRRAVADRKNDFKRILSKKTQYVALKAVHKTKSIYIDDENIRAEIPGLLHNLSIVEYNGNIWWDVHPVVLSILESMDDHVR